MLKDLFVNIQQQSDNLDLRKFMKPAHFLTETTSAYKALEKFKVSKVHYALVTNEYGLVIGIVTIDDILKALVGDVSEFYTEEYQLSQREDGSWLVDGQFPMAEFLLHFDIEDAADAASVNTIGGLVLKALNHIPNAGEKIQWRNLHIEVVDMDGVRIDKVLVRKV
jgi:putative hemolysin